MGKKATRISGWKGENVNPIRWDESRREDRRSGFLGYKIYGGNGRNSPGNLHESSRMNLQNISWWNN